jgi:hypothetical protein
MTLCVLPFTAKCYRENLAFGGPVLRNECYIPDLTYKVWGGVRKTMYICIRLHLGAFNGGAFINLAHESPRGRAAGIINYSKTYNGADNFINDLNFIADNKSNLSPELLTKKGFNTYITKD